jgi:hypothetical protein
MYNKNRLYTQILTDYSLSSYTTRTRFIKVFQNCEDFQEELLEIKAQKERLEITKLERSLNLLPSKQAAQNAVVVTEIHDFDDA